MTTIYVMLGFCCLCLLIIVIKMLYDWKCDVDFEQIMKIQIEEELKNRKKKK